MLHLVARISSLENIKTNEKDMDFVTDGNKKDANVGLFTNERSTVHENSLQLKAADVKDFKDFEADLQKCVITSDKSDESGKDRFPSENLDPEAAGNGATRSSSLFTDNWEKKPEWLDMEKFRRGQAVAMKYYAAISFSELVSLLMVFTFKDGLAVLVSTGKSHTPFTAFKRYLSTALRVKSWYTDDIWQPGTEGYKNIKAVRIMHEATFKKVQYSPSEEIERKFTIEKLYSSGKKVKVWSPLYEKIRLDFLESCPLPEDKNCLIVMSRKTELRWVQAGHALSQFGFIGSFLLFPEKFGAHGVTDEEMSSFIYLWRCLGYALGIKDNFNLCDGSLGTVRERCRNLIRLSVKSNLRELSRDWEHMSRCLAEGVSYYSQILSFELLLLFVCDILEISAPRIRASLTLFQKVQFYSLSFICKFLCRLPGVRQCVNWVAESSVKWASNADHKWLKELQQKSYAFTDN